MHFGIAASFIGLRCVKVYSLCNLIFFMTFDYLDKSAYDTDDSNRISC